MLEFIILILILILMGMLYLSIQKQLDANEHDMASASAAASAAAAAAAAASELMNDYVILETSGNRIRIRKDMSLPSEGFATLNRAYIDGDMDSDSDSDMGTDEEEDGREGFTNLSDIERDLRRCNIYPIEDTSFDLDESGNHVAGMPPTRSSDTEHIFDACGNRIVLMCPPPPPTRDSSSNHHHHGDLPPYFYDHHDDHDDRIRKDFTSGFSWDFPLFAEAIHLLRSLFGGAEGVTPEQIDRHDARLHSQSERSSRPPYVFSVDPIRVGDVRYPGAAPAGSLPLDPIEVHDMQRIQTGGALSSVSDWLTGLGSSRGSSSAGGRTNDSSLFFMSHGVNQPSNASTKVGGGGFGSDALPVPVLSDFSSF